MQFLVRGKVTLLLKIGWVLVSLWMLILLSRSKAGQNPFRWLEYRDDDDMGPEKVCNCSAILRGESDAVDEAKILAITKDFRKSAQISDEYYINATRDCW